jgi:seryl-tRNA synthetase
MRGLEWSLRRALARDVLALLAERDELKRDLHFSETMHQADLDERVKIEKDCRALRERVAALEETLREIAEDAAILEIRAIAEAALAGVPVTEEEETTKCRACGREFPKRFGQDFCDDCSPHVRGVPVAEEET